MNGALAADSPARWTRWRESIGIWRRTIDLLFRIAPLACVGYAVLVAVLVAIPLVQVWLAKLVVDAVVARHHDALVLACLYALTLVVPACLQPLQMALAIWLEDQTVAAIDRRLIDAGARLADLTRVECPAFQDELYLVQMVTLYVPRLFAALQQGVGSILTLIGLLLLLARIQPLLALALAGAAVPHLLAEQRLMVLLYQAMADRSRPAREMDYCLRVTTEATAAKEICVFALGPFFLDRFRRSVWAALAEVRRLRLAQLRLSALGGGLHALALAGGFWYVAAQAGVHRLTPGDVALYVNALIQAEVLLLFLPGWVGGTLLQTVPYARGLWRVLDSARPGVALPPDGGGLAVPDRLRSGISIEHVSFSYPESPAPVICDVSVHLAAGTVTALVGANGAGKSTLVKLLTRMYDPDEGVIRLDGVPIAQYNLQEWRSRLAVAFQDSARFALTLGENIAIGTGGLEYALARIIDAAEQTGADEVAACLPQGYETPLTRRFAGGVDLSGGEWQRVALARAFMRDAALVILDEPAAALDAAAEHRLFERFRALVAGRTALIISHRLSTARMADQIVVLDGGRIVEAGSHAELLRLGGRYAALYAMQAERYRP